MLDIEQPLLLFICYVRIAFAYQIKQCELDFNHTIQVDFIG